MRPYLLGLLLSQLSLLLDLLLFVDGDVRVSLSVCLPLPGCLLLTAHFVVRIPGFIQLWTNQKLDYLQLWLDKEHMSAKWT